VGAILGYDSRDGCVDGMGSRLAEPNGSAAAKG
jgi:hypothetical protein